MVGYSALVNIRLVLRRFNVADYREHVISCFPTELREIAKQKLKNKTKKVIVDELVRVIKREEQQTLETLHIRLCTVVVSLHSKRRNWHAYEMKNIVDREYNVRRLLGKLLQGCRLEQLDFDIDIVKRDDIFWFTFIEKKVSKNRSIERRNPVYYAHIAGTPYLFCTLAKQTKIEKVFLGVFQSTSIADLTLVGHDIESLHKILLRKGGGVASLRVPSYNVQKPRTIHGSKDYTQHENRKEFAEKCFPVDAKIETLSLVNGDDVWKGEPGGEDLEFRWAAKLKSPNIFLALKEFTENNLIEPEDSAAYALLLGKEGKTKIKLPIIPNID